PRADVMAEDVPTTADDTIVATPAAARLVSAAPDLATPEPEAASASEAPAQTPPEPAAESQPAQQAEEPGPSAAAQEEDEAAAEEPAAEAEPRPEAVENRKNWYVVKVQSNREDTIKEAIERRVKKEGLEEFFGQIVIPVEKYVETKPDKTGRKVNRTK